MKRRQPAIPTAEQLSVGFEGIDEVQVPGQEPGPDTMRQIVSLRMPDALLDRVEAAAQKRGVSPSSLMRALIAAGLDRSYAAVASARQPGEDVAAELAALRRAVDDLARRLPDPKR
jgi:predicted transcriptional regulator